MGKSHLIFEWQEVSAFKFPDRIDRVQVEGGYLYRNIINIDGIDHVNVTFVPSEECLHEWSREHLLTIPPKRKCLKCDLTLNSW